MKILAATVATALLTAASAPAFAMMEPAGNVPLWDAPSHSSIAYSGLTGDIVAFTARGDSDVACGSVTATFDDGSTALMYRGTLAPDDQVEMRVPGGIRNIRRMDFNCFAIDRGRASLNVAADITPDSELVPLG